MAGRERWLSWLRGRRGLVTWWVLISCTAVNGLVVGYGSLHFLQFSLNRGDHLVSGGGYAAAGAVLAVAAAGAAGWRAPVSVVLGSAVLAVGSAACAVWSFGVAARFPPDAGRDGPWDGVGGVLAGPWTWLLLLCGSLGVIRLIGRRRGP
ncbi:hypothetical protein [Actinoplanes xinjiangensis]|uniref:hypothetical protein n=1 Tax=Actinoplanes xinjiangensis TaxID=512350 RepID=UPI003424AE12